MQQYQKRRSSRKGDEKWKIRGREGKPYEGMFGMHEGRMGFVRLRVISTVKQGKQCSFRVLTQDLLPFTS